MKVSTQTISAVVFNLFVFSQCVLPNENTSGLELSWSLQESNSTVGTTSKLIRTCTGVGAENIEVYLVDHDDADRSRSWLFPCTRGMTHPEDESRIRSSIYLDLQTGSYGVSLRAWGSVEKGRPLLAYSDQEIAIANEVNSHLWLAHLLPLLMKIELLNLHGCQDISMRLEYANLEQDVLFPQNPDANPDSDPNPNPPPSAESPIYRPSLTSDKQLVIDNLPHSCSSLVTGIHHFESIDRGSYRLVVNVDGTTCNFPVVLEDSNSIPLQLDFEDFACLH